MGFAMVKSAVIDGLEVKEVCVEADTANGLPAFHMVGYLSSEVKEAGERVKTAIRHTGIKMQPQKMVVNLSPADIRKRGAAFDLPIAAALVLSTGRFKNARTDKVLFIGELGLDARIRKVKGILPIALYAKKMGYRLCIVPKENEEEGFLAEGIGILGVSALCEVWEYLENGTVPADGAKIRKNGKPDEKEAYGGKDFSDICGQQALKRASEVAAAGGHNILYIGPPGSGKTMAAQRIMTILPELTKEESMETTAVYSVAGLLDEKNPMITRPPFREVHHTATRAALVGGGLYPAPGELSLANGGVLFLDELAEFKKPVLEALREPLETREVRISRRNGTYVFPANVILAAAMNPCPCGNYPDHERCGCTPGEIRRHIGKISGPFLDRMDICMEAPRITYRELNAERREETSAEIRKRVVRARERQMDRFSGSGVRTNSRIPAKDVERYCALGEKEKELLERVFEKLGLTARSYHKILKVARTIADLEGSGRVRTAHIAEAVSYRNVNGTYWKERKAGTDGTGI